MVVLKSLLYLCASCQLPVLGQKPSKGGSSGSSGQNVHVTFGDANPCTAPPSGNCADFTITADVVINSLTGFTTYNGGTLKTSSIDYYADWWETNVGTGASVATDFCSSGAAASQTSVSKAYNGVTYTAGSGTWTMGTESTPAAACENYCSAVGSETPPLMGTTFGTSYTRTFSFAPSSKSRADISNQVGYAVDGVVIFSPFTGKSTVAPYDETLDTCIGHPANGLYHYHGFSPCIHGESGTQTGDSITHSKIYGWAFDGFPIYGPYGYSDGNDVSSAVVRVTGGYACASDGSACTTTEQQAVSSNWAYAVGNGMLDDCNGRWTKTPEFPDGMYVYVLNIQSNGSPDFPGVPYCLQATAAGSGSEASNSEAQATSEGSNAEGSNPEADEAVTTTAEPTDSDLSANGASMLTPRLSSFPVLFLAMISLFLKPTF